MYLYKDKDAEKTDKALTRERFILFTVPTVVVLLFFYFAFIAPPRNFPKNYNLESGENLSSVSTSLQEKNLIKSPFWFKTFVYIFTFSKGTVLSGVYSFPKPESVITLSWRITNGDFNTLPTKVTIPEGLSSKQIAEILAKKLQNFNEEKFINIVNKNDLEGYLFPDTYYFLPNVTEAEIVTRMNQNYKKQILKLSEEIKSFGKSEFDVIKMASILEEEARLMDTRRTVAGILWKRISIGMALQVDSSFTYILGKSSKELTVDDLKIDSPYNSYTHLGLPPTPISNPGLASIQAAITPIKTKYLYFLTDKEGNMHYAVTLDEHLANISKYLR